MTLLVPIVMFGWIPLVILIFLLAPPRKAVIIAFVTGWLFLPEVTYELKGLPDYTKMSATCVGILFSTLLFHGDHFRHLRWEWVDLPMVVWCAVPFFTSLSNGLGFYDGVTGVLDTTVTWGFPYLIGRLHFRDFTGLHVLARGLLIGGLIYVPFCLFEIKMSPQLNRWIYGFHLGVFWEAIRFGGWRPQVFMETGLMVGMWMCTTALIGVWLWTTGALTHLWSYRTGLPVLLLVVTAVLCKSLGALVLMVVGLTVLWATRKFRTPAFVMGLALLPPVYVGARTVGGWSGQVMIDAARVISEQRAASLEVRLKNEDILVAHAAKRLWLGWGGYCRNRVYDERTGQDMTITDGLWVIALGTYGVIGLAAILSVCLLPALLLLRRMQVPWWWHPESAGAAAVAVALLLYGCDNLLNAMVNPVFMLCSGGLMSLYAGLSRYYAVAAPAPAERSHTSTALIS